MEKYPSSEGERSAISGYHPQYEITTWFAFEKLIDKTLEKIILVDPMAGQVDDFQIYSINRVDAYQVKWRKEPRFFSYKSHFIKERKSKPSMLRQLADGWKKLRKPNIRAIVHLYTNDSPSKRDHMESSNGVIPDGINNFEYFLNNIWNPAKENSEDFIENLPEDWQTILEDIRQNSGLSITEFGTFLRDCELDFRQIIPDHSEYEEEFNALYHFLLEEVANSDKKKPLIFSRDDLIRELGWKDRFTYRSSQNFILGDYYCPVEDKIGEFQEKFLSNDNGYMVLMGPPGIGKSSFLSNLEIEGNTLLIKYFINIEGSGATVRFKADGFNYLHDLLLKFENLGFKTKTKKIKYELFDLQSEFQQILEQLNKKWLTEGLRTVIIIDGIDHLERGKSPQIPLTDILLYPLDIPEGIFFILGTQNLNLIGSEIKYTLEDEKRIIKLENLSKNSVLKIIKQFNIQFNLTSNQEDLIYEKSNGHPLALIYLLKYISSFENSIEIDNLLKEYPTYKTKIEEVYYSHWNSIKSEGKFVWFFGQIARLRKFIDLKWINQAFGIEEANILERFKQYFRVEQSFRAYFFHSSFKEFLLEESQKSLGESLKDRDLVFHRSLVKKILNSDFSEYDPLRYELLYHLYHSEEFDKIIELASQDFFREQFFKFRPLQDIETDIKIFLDTINRMEKGDKLPLVILIGAEFYQRKNSLKDFYAEILSILMYLEKVEIVLDYCRDGYKLNVPAIVALGLSEDLFNIFNYAESREGVILEEIKNQAKILFNLAEPLEFFSSEHVSDEDYKRLFSWIAAAVNFYDLEKILEKTVEIRLSFNESEYSKIKVHIIDFLYTLVLEKNILQDKSRELELLEDQLDLTIESDLITWIKLLIQKTKFYIKINSDDQVNVLVQKIEKIIEQRRINLPISIFRRISEVYLELGEDFSKILHFYKDEFTQHILELNNYINFSENSYSQQFLGILSLMRILIVIGKIDSDQILNQPEILDEKSTAAFFFRKALYIVADIWVNGYTSSKLSIDKFEEIISNFLVSLEKFQNVDQYKIWAYNIPWKDLIEELIMSWGNFYPKHLDILKNRLIEEWNATSTNIYWYSGYIRSALLALTKFYADRTFIYEELSNLEYKMLKGRDRHGRLAQLVQQAKIYMKLEDKENVEKILNTFMRETLKVGYRKDPQLNSLINSLSLFVEDYPEKIEEKIALLASMIPILNDLTEGPAERWATEELLQVSTLILPSKVFQLFDWFIENESGQYFSCLNYILSVILEKYEVDLDLAKLIMKNYFIPLSKAVPNQFIKSLIRKVYFEQGEVPLKVFSEELVLEVRKFTLSSTRCEWLRTIVISLAELGFSVDYLAITTEEINKNHDEQYIVLEDNNRMDLIEVLNYVGNFSTYTELKNKIKDEKSFPWEVVIKKIVIKLTDTDFDTISHSINNEYILNHLSKFLFSNGTLKRAEKICLQILEKKDSTKFPSSAWWDPYYFESLTILARINPSLITKRLIPSIIKHISNDQFYIFDKILVLDKIISISTMQNDNNRKENWDAVENYLTALFDNVELCEFKFSYSSKNDKKIQEEILSLIINNLEHSINAISIKSIEICLSLLKMHNEPIWELISSQLDDSDKKHYGMLKLLYSYSQEFDNFPKNIIEKLKNLFNNPNIFYRIYIKDIFNKLGIELNFKHLDILTEFKNILSIKYPKPIQNPQIDHLINFYFDTILNRLSISSEFPKSTIREALKKLIFLEDSEILFKDKDDNMVLNHFHNVGLEFWALKPEFVAIRKAIYQITAILIDEELIDVNWVDLARSIHYFDNQLLNLNSFNRSGFIISPAFDKYHINSQNFLDKMDEILDNYYKKKFDGKVMIAEFTKFRFLNRPNGFEERKFLVLKNNINKQDFKKVDIKIINYEDLIIKSDNRDIIIQNRPLWRDISSSDWIALNPLIAKKLKWKISEEGLFRWVNEEGLLMVETKKWVDGFFDHQGVHFCTVGEGWIVIASQAAFEQIKSLGNIKGIFTLERGFYSSERYPITKKISRKYQF
ncbi:hypothetical protein LCGC14_0892890 [marine sediment metagenome]|uniref:Uncharacterized protein n=1 Tax=marine sediment metagenome TaxID=412755 RepID=A0A0F9RHX8_9ZZZZ